MFKRICDFLISVICLVLFLWLFVLIAIFIKFDSKGPILFKQKRIGKKGKLFYIYKFRTMKVDTPNISTEKLGDPSRFITRVGGILRKTSLDELPQLLNIIKGDMSIVGPRPALYNQTELNKMRNDLNINSIRPGLTGYAQVNGRDYITDEKKVEYDLYYLENQTLWLDIRILYKTVFNVLKSEGIKTN